MVDVLSIAEHETVDRPSVVGKYALPLQWRMARICVSWAREAGLGQISIPSSMAVLCEMLSREADRSGAPGSQLARSFDEVFSETAVKR
jgi:hypothetical protein